MTTLKIDGNATIPVRLMVVDGATPVTSTTAVDMKISEVMAGSAPAAAAGSSGSVTRQAAQANSTAVDVAGIVADFNALLAKLRAAGVLAT